MTYARKCLVSPVENVCPMILANATQEINFLSKNGTHTMIHYTEKYSIV